MEFLPQFVNEVFNKAIVNNISLSGFQITLPFPYIVGNVVTSYTERQGFLRQPEIRQNVIMLILFRWRKDKHKCCDICCTGKVKSAITNTTCKHLFIKSNLAFIPFFHRHPTYCLFYPLIQTKLSESIFLAGSFLCRITRCYDLIHTDGLIQ